MSDDAADPGAAMGPIRARCGSHDAWAVSMPWPEEFQRSCAIMHALGIIDVKLQVVKEVPPGFEGLRVMMTDHETEPRASFRLAIRAQTDVHGGVAAFRDHFVVNVKKLLQLLHEMRCSSESVLHLSRERADPASVCLTRIENWNQTIYTLPTKLESDGAAEPPDFEDISMPITCDVLAECIKAHVRSATEMHAAQVCVAVEYEKTAAIAAPAASFLRLGFTGEDKTERTDVLQSAMRREGGAGEDAPPTFVVADEISFSNWKSLRDAGKLRTACSAWYPTSFLWAMVKGLDRASRITLCLGKDRPLIVQLTIGTLDSHIRMMLAPCVGGRSSAVSK